jgi:hypothetical protein
MVVCFGVVSTLRATLSNRMRLLGSARCCQRLHPNTVALNIFLMIRSLLHRGASWMTHVMVDKISIESVILHVYDYSLIFS